MIYRPEAISAAYIANLEDEVAKLRGEYNQAVEIIADKERTITGLRAALKYAVDVLQTIEMAYDDRKDEKLDLDQIKELAGYAIETTKKALAITDISGK